MEKINYIYLNGYFNKEMASSFKKILRLVQEGIIIVRVNSLGGSVQAMNHMITFLYFMGKYKKHKIVIEIEHAESAALMFALSFSERHVVQKSTGSIHLPVPSGNRKVSEKLWEEKRIAATNFYSRRTKIQKEKIKVWDGVLLDAKQMLDMGIATKLVETFLPKPLTLHVERFSFYSVIIHLLYL